MTSPPLQPNEVEIPRRRIARVGGERADKAPDTEAYLTVLSRNVVDEAEFHLV
jgi:hypothetical protein